LDCDVQGFGYGGTGKKSNNNQFDTYGKPFGKGDTVGCFLDLDAMQIHWSLNGTEFPVAFQLSPSLKNRAFFPTVTLKVLLFTLSLSFSLSLSLSLSLSFSFSLSLSLSLSPYSPHTYSVLLQLNRN
jgi:hypothetical protein